jgi:hypothetical protein
MESKFRVPKTKYIKDIPNKYKELAKDPKIKYFNPASVCKKDLLVR